MCGKRKKRYPSREGYRRLSDRTSPLTVAGYGLRLDYRPPVRFVSRRALPSKRAIFRLARLVLREIRRDCIRAHLPVYLESEDRNTLTYQAADQCPYHVLPTHG